MIAVMSIQYAGAVNETDLTVEFLNESGISDPFFKIANDTDIINSSPMALETTISLSNITEKNQQFNNEKNILKNSDLQEDWVFQYSNSMTSDMSKIPPDLHQIQYFTNF